MARRQTNQNGTPATEAEVQNASGAAGSAAAGAASGSGANPEEGGAEGTGGTEGGAGGSPSDSGSKPTEKAFVVSNPLNKNLRLFGTTGKIIEFDENGSAVCEYAEAEHFSRIEGYTVKEAE